MSFSNLHTFLHTFFFARNSPSSASASHQQELPSPPETMTTRAPSDTVETFAEMATTPESTCSDLGAAGYFAGSVRSSMSSDASSLKNFDGQASPLPSRTGTSSSSSSTGSTFTTTHQLEPPMPVDALSRHFPKPTHEATMEEMLARPPNKWTLGYYVKNAREAPVPVVDKEKRARDFENAKRELLQAQQDLKRRR